MVATAVILDLDGTVWDSRPWYANTIARLSGVSVLQVERKLEEGASIVIAARDCHVSNSRLALAAKQNGGAIELYEHVVPTLDFIRERGTPIGFVTNLPGWLARPMLISTGLSKYAAAIATPRRGIPAKPKPHGIRRVLAEIASELESESGVWFVGDETVDSKAAEAASVKFAWASFGYGLVEPNRTDKVLKSFKDLLDL